MKLFFKRTWIFFLATGVVAGSTGLLYLSMQAARKEGEDKIRRVQGYVSIEKEPEKKPTGEASKDAETKDEDATDAYTPPNYACQVRPDGGQVRDADLTVQQGADLAVRCAEQIFGVDLEGGTVYVQYIGYMEQGSMQFDIQTKNVDDVFWMVIDSESGALRSIVNDVETVELVQLDGEQFRNLSRRCITQIKKIMEDDLGQKGNIVRVQNESAEQEQGNAYPTQITDLFFDVLTDDGMWYRFCFSAEDGIFPKLRHLICEKERAQ